MQSAVVIYARKSSEQEDRQILSIDSQIAELKQLALKFEVTPKYVISESFSAKAPGREKFNEMVALIEAGKVDTIFAWHPDRLSRNAVDAAWLIHLLDTGKLKAIITPSQSFKNTPNDKFLFNLLTSQAKLENDNKSINVKRGLKTKVEMGCYPGVAPLGYLNNKYKEKGKKDVYLDAERGPILRKIFDLILEGMPPMRALEIANEKLDFRTPHGNKLARTTLYRVLTMPFYYGEFEYPKGSGKWYKGNHEPLITVEEYDRVQTFLGRDGRPRARQSLYNFPYKAMMRCGECGAAITIERKVKRQKNGNVHEYVYYHCTKRIKRDCTQKCVEAKEIDDQIAETLASVKIPQEFHEWAIEALREENEAETSSRAQTMKRQRSSYDETVRMMDELLDMRLKKQISDEQFADKKASLEHDKTRYKELLNDTDRRIDWWMNVAGEAMQFLCEAQQKFIEGDADRKTRILNALGSNFTLLDGKLVVSVKETLLSVTEQYHQMKQAGKMFEPLKFGSTKQRTDTISDVSSMWLRGWGSNPRPSRYT